MAGLRDFQESKVFEPKIKAALTFAEKMTLDAHSVSEEDMVALRRHYSDEEIIELSSVAGVMSYFNRFATAFRIDLSGSNAPYESYRPEY